MTMTKANALLKHFLTTLAYRTNKTLKDAPADFADFSPGNGIRTPHDLLYHMTEVLIYARSFMEPVSRSTARLPSFAEEVERFYDNVLILRTHVQEDTHLAGTSWDRILQGPLADAMTHVGQLATLRRLAGSPLPPENYLKADMVITE